MEVCMIDMNKADDEFSKIRSKGRRNLSKKEMRKARKHLRIPALRPVLTYVRDFLALLHAVFSDRYKVSLEAIITLGSAILYLIWVFDIIPDFIPIIGYLDDMAVIITATKVCALELEDFQKWKDRKK